MRGKLNLFQATMLRWRELYPYNAVHVVTVGQPLQPARLSAHLASGLQSAGLTGFILDRRRARYEYRGGPAAVALTTLKGGEDALRMEEREIERQLNLPFPSDGAFDPFRFFAIDSGAAFRLGLAYDHFIAGGDSIAVLLENFVVGYTTTAAAAWTPRLYPRTYASLFRRHAGHALRGLRRLPALAASCKRSSRAPCQVGGATRIGFLSRRVAAADYAGLLRTARQWGVTRNDLFMALLLQALAAVTPPRGPAQRRHELGVAAIVNVRGEFEADAADTFGQFLASLRVSHPVPPGIGARELAQALHVETTRSKTEKLYLQTLLGLGWTALAWRFLGAERQRGFLAKHYPIWAGVTSLSADPLWRAPGSGAAAPEYLRAVPTGPLAPVVVAITTCGGVMRLGVSFRCADLSEELAAALAAEFLRHISLLPEQEPRISTAT